MTFWNALKYACSLLEEGEEGIELHVRPLGDKKYRLHSVISTGYELRLQLDAMQEVIDSDWKVYF